MARSDYPSESAWRTRPENIARIRAERGVDEAEARRIARGHGSTPEHGKVSKRSVSTHTVYETNSNYQAALILDRAARESERRKEREGKSNLRVSIVTELKDGSKHRLWTSASKGGKPGMTATYAAHLRGEQGGSVKSFVASSPVFSASEEALAEEGWDEDDIELMEITVYDFE